MYKVPLGITSNGDLTFAVPVSDKDHCAHPPFLDGSNHIVLMIDEQGTFHPNTHNYPDSKKVAFRFPRNTIAFKYSKQRKHGRSNLIQMSQTRRDNGGVFLKSIEPLSKLPIAPEFNPKPPVEEQQPVITPSSTVDELLEDGRIKLAAFNDWMELMRREGRTVHPVIEDAKILVTVVSEVAL